MDACEIKADPMLFARISELVATNNSKDEVLQKILEESVWVAEADRGFLALVDHDKGELVVKYITGDGWSEEKRLDRLKISEDDGKGITVHVAATGEPYSTDDVANDPYYLKSFDDVKSEVAVPLIDGFKMIRGVINIESKKLCHFTQQHICTLTGLTDLATIALTMADHRTREAALVQVAKELNSLSDTDLILHKFINVAAEALNFEDCSLFLFDERSGKLVLRASRGHLKGQISEAMYEIGEGLTGWVAQHDNSIRLFEPTKDLRWRGRFEEMPAQEVGSFMAVPIHGHRGVIGVLRVQRKKSVYKWLANEFNEYDESILSTIAAQLGIALDNARLVVQLVKTERMAAWGELSARSAHMIGNRVFAIKGDINELEYLLNSKKIDSETSLELSESIKKGLYMLEEILQEFREFVKATHLDIEEVDINKLINEAIQEGFPRRSLSKLSVILTPNIAPVLADPNKLKRCFTELLENAVNFQPDGGEIKITTHIADSRSKRWLQPGQRTKKHVLIRFEDNGPGVEIEDKMKIFTPFYTSRAKGMGLGLSIVKGIVDAHDGFIIESGKPGKGAKFNILLPADIAVKKRKQKNV